MVFFFFSSFFSSCLQAEVWRSNGASSVAWGSRRPWCRCATAGRRTWCSPVLPRATCTCGRTPRSLRPSRLTMGLCFPCAPWTRCVCVCVYPHTCVFMWESSFAFGYFPVCECVWVCAKSVYIVSGYCFCFGSLRLLPHAKCSNLFPSGSLFTNMSLQEKFKEKVTAQHYVFTKEVHCIMVLHHSKHIRHSQNKNGARLLPVLPVPEMHCAVLCASG